MGFLFNTKPSSAPLGMGESSVFTSGLTFNPTLLLMGVGALVLASFLFGSSPERVQKEAKRRAKGKRRADIRKKIKDLEKEQSGLGWF